MNTLAWVFILLGALVMSAVSRGRVLNLSEDLSDAFLAIVSADTDALGEVLARKGDTNEASGNIILENGMMADKGVKGDISAAAIKRGTAAKGYRWTATGPDYYDCSGLMWRACQDAGAYTGPRFTTRTFALMAKSFARVSNPQPDDIVVWTEAVGTGHMGVVTGPNKFYSARSVKSGIGTSNIEGFQIGRAHV